MADLDTRQKRSSAVGLRERLRRTAPLADGAISQADREHIAGSYAGILSGGVVVVVDAVISVSAPDIFTLATSYGAPIRGTTVYVQEMTVVPYQQTSIGQADVFTVANSYGSPIRATAPPNQITRGFLEA